MVNSNYNKQSYYNRELTWSIYNIEVMCIFVDVIIFI